MEVHPPEHPIHSVRDFFLHLFTITVGLLIALGLEGLVEAGHHHHLLRTAEGNLQRELRSNRATVASDEHSLDRTEAQLEKGITLLNAVKAHTATEDTVNPQWVWDSPESAAWDTARDSGAIALMTYDQAQGYAVLYGQQTAVSNQAILYIRDIYTIGAPLQGGKKLSEISPQEADAMIASTQHALADLRLLRDLCRSLDHIYDHAHIVPASH
jgi:hypothetical protein